LLSLALSADPEWDDAFLTGVEHACESYALPLIGGDTIALPEGAPRVLAMTAIGRAGVHTPSRGDGRPGDALWLVGTVGDAAAGLALLSADKSTVGTLVDIYRRPVPQLEAGRVLAPHARAMMDVSDGLLLDAQRMAEVSGCAAVIDLDALPLSREFQRACGADREGRLFAATGGDDYALLAALPQKLDPATLSLPPGTTITRIGKLEAGKPAIRLVSGGEPIEVPEKLGYEHRGPVRTPMADRP
jgi:thiamine-monophosphate kinase